MGSVSLQMRICSVTLNPSIKPAPAVENEMPIRWCVQQELMQSELREFLKQLPVQYLSDPGLRQRNRPRRLIEAFPKRRM
jgi:hypothetical protein